MQISKGVKHIGIVVRDIDRAIEHWQALGAANFRKFYFSTSRGTCGKVFKNGRPHKIEAVMASGELGNIGIELAQPLDDKSVYADYLREHGEGLHHVCPDTDQVPFAEVCDRIIERLNDKRRREAQRDWSKSLPAMRLSQAA